MADEQRRGGDGKINLDELAKYAGLEVDPELVKALTEVDPKAVQAAIKAGKKSKKAIQPDRDSNPEPTA